MTGTRVSAVSAYTHPHGPPPLRPRRHRVRELVCAYRPLRDCEGRIISVSSLAIENPRVAAQNRQHGLKALSNNLRHNLHSLNF